MILLEPLSVEANYYVAFHKIQVFTNLLINSFIISQPNANVHSNDLISTKQKTYNNLNQNLKAKIFSQDTCGTTTFKFNSNFTSTL